jgi:hypothetical protein
MSKRWVLMTSSTAMLACTVAFLLLPLAGCNEEPPPSLYDPSNLGSGAQPTVATVSPASTALAGVTVITITGTNFSTTLSDNLVYFDATLGTVLSATATQLTVRPPNLVKDTVLIKIAVKGASLFSNPPIMYQLQSAAFEFGKGPENEDPWGVACDSAGNVYVSLTKTSDGANLGVKKITPAGVRSDFSLLASVTKWSGMKVGPGGVIYCARSLNALYRIPAAGGTAAIWSQPTVNGMGKVNDFDFDQAGNIWGGGDGTRIYRVTSAGLVKGFNFTANIRTVRVFNGALYVGGKADTVEAVWSFPIISSDSLGTPTIAFNASARYAPLRPAVNALTFAADGDMYVGIDHADAIVVVRGAVVTPLYPGVLEPTAIAFAWGKGNELYYSRGGTTVHRLIRVNVLKPGAPYYGRQL